MLFQRLLSHHPELGHVFHSFSAAAMYGPERLQQFLERCEAADEVQRDWGSNFPDMNGATFESSEKSLRDKIEEIERDGKIVCAKDHLACVVTMDVIASGGEAASDENPTRLPDDLLQTVTHPVFLIRHPALMVGSFWKTQLTVYKMQPDDDLFMVMSTLRWTALLYDWFVQGGVRPLVIDAHDIVNDTESVMRNVCEAVGIDPDGVQYEWQAEGNVDFADNHMRRTFMNELQNSTGVKKAGSRSGEIDLEDQVSRWRAEWGVEVAQKLRRRVEEEMPLYERLMKVAMKV